MVRNGNKNTIQWYGSAQRKFKHKMDKYEKRRQDAQKMSHLTTFEMVSIPAQQYYNEADK